MQKKETILIVDDTPQNIDILVEILRNTYTVIFSTTGEGALARCLKSPQPSLILLDVVMPGMDGYEVCRRLKADLRTSNIPVIFLTAKQESSDEETGLKLGAVDYLHKPSHPAIVLQRVRIHLELHNQNLALEQKVQERTRELEATRREIVHRLGRAAEYRDNETGNHVMRMSNFCHRLAVAAGIGAKDAEALKLAAAMHDVGKIGIPDNILLKPGRLDGDEWSVMQSHCQIGGDIIGTQQVDLLALARSIAMTHHEKWDGSGYPQGLAGESIPIEGRIASICDVYDALVSVRPCKQAWSNAQAMQFLRDNAGTAFDPGLVALFTGMDADIQEIAAQHSD